MQRLFSALSLRRHGVSERRPRKACTASVMMAVLVSGCASDGPASDAPASDGVEQSPSGVSTTAQASPKTVTTLPSTTRTDVGPVSSSTTSAQAGDTTEASQLVLVNVATGLDRPVDLAIRPGDNALYVVEQGGIVFQIETDSAAPREVLDVSKLTKAGGEQGLLGLAFSPDGEWGYIDYTDRNGDTVVAGIPVADDGRFDTSAIQTILQVKQPYPNHNGGDLEFGPDGMLYIATGDGGSGGDPQRHASDTNSLLGKLLRIDPTPAATQPYRIPADNPFAETSGQGKGTGAPEVWSWGLRNPWRFAFDPADGSLWIADVGQNTTEEIDHVTPRGTEPAGRGANFGWSALEGDEVFNGDVSSDGAIAPVWVYPHGPGCSISGGVVYRGRALTGFTGDYFYGDFCSGELSAFREADATNQVLLTGLGPISAVRTGADDEIYVLTMDGTVGRLAAAD